MKLIIIHTHNIGVELAKRILEIDTELLFLRICKADIAIIILSGIQYLMLMERNIYLINLLITGLEKYRIDLVKEKGLSIIEPKNKSIHYKEWMHLKEGNSWKLMMKSDIDTTINNLMIIVNLLNSLEEKKAML